MGKISDATDLLIVVGLGYLSYKVLKNTEKGLNPRSKDYLSGYSPATTYFNFVKFWATLPSRAKVWLGESPRDL